MRREVREQASKDYWRQRQQSEKRRFRFVKLRHSLWSKRAKARDSRGIIQTTLWSLIRASLLGGLLVAAILSVEWLLVNKAGLRLVATGESTPPIAAFPQLAVQVLAAFLGFYLATVGIVLGNAYEEVSARVRALILGTARAHLYLSAIGMAIGAGLLLVLLGSLGVLSFGYLTLSGYALLVCFAGWAFWRLALGAFHLMNPVELGREPLLALYRAVDQLDSDGLLRDDAVLRAAASDADRSLHVLAELIRLTHDRQSVDRAELATMVEDLFLAVRAYGKRKHRLAPDSGWFIREPAYPRWFEAGYSERSIALQTATSLQVRYEPVGDWLERRAAELSVAALESCVATNDRDAALRIVRAAATTAQSLASSYRIDDAIVFAGIVRDGCWSLQTDTSVAKAIAGEPPLILTSVLLGWKSAVEDWPTEISRVVEETEWDAPSTQEVAIRGSTRVWAAAQRVLREIRAEREIEGRRVTPNWYIRSVLAAECAQSLREFSSRMPELIRGYVSTDALQEMSPEAQATAGLQSHELLRKALFLAEMLPETAAELGAMQRGDEPLATPEVGSLTGSLDEIEPAILEQIAEALINLVPVHEKSEPDYFGHALSTLVHQTEQALSGGNIAVVQRIFPKLIVATLAFHEHVVKTYKPPTYQFTPAILNPMLDLFELSGLALVYESLRDDRSAEPIRQAWSPLLGKSSDSQKRASAFLDILDVAAGELLVDITRTKWQSNLANQVKEAGYGLRAYPFQDTNLQHRRTAPRLIRMLGVSDDWSVLSVDAYELFAAGIIGPTAGLDEDKLRARPGLKRYFERHDLILRQDREPSAEAPVEGSEGEAEHD